MEFNKYQSTFEDLQLDSYPQEVQDEFMEAINSVPLIQHLISPNRPLAKDCPRDEEGKIIVDLTNPPIIEDTDYFRPVAIFYKQHGKMTHLRPNANPNSEFGKWIREEIRRIWHGYVRESDGAWVTGDMYFYLNYCPIIQSKIRKGTKIADRIVDMPEFWEGIWWRSNYIEQARLLGHHCAEIAKRGAAHPYNSVVYTPEGKKLWKDVQVGDLLFGDDGLTTRVINIPFDDECDIYEITLKDGRVVRASDNHLWRVLYRGKEKVMTTLEMLNSYKQKRIVSDRVPSGVEYIISIPSNKGVEWKRTTTKVDPYTFGLLLGDGSFRHSSCYYTCEDSDFEEIKNYIPYKYTRWNSKYAYRIHIDQWSDILDSYGLNNKKSIDKFIPDEYKYNSREVRLEILKGLIDSDGYLNRRGVYTIALSSKTLIEDIAFIARSLGYNCSYTKQNAGYKKAGEYIECSPAHVLSIYTEDILCKLTRKIRTTGYTGNYAKSHVNSTRVVDIKYVGKERAKCVTVDNESHCYLIDDFITTHNSKSYFVASILAKLFILGENKETSKSVRAMVTAYQKEYLTKDGTLNKFVEMIDHIAQNTEFPSKRLRSSLQDMQWKMGYVDLDTGTQKGTLNEIIGVSSKDDPDKLRGKRSSRIIIEEFGNFPKITDTYRVILPSVQEGNIIFGQMILIGTGGSEGADFAGANEIIYNPLGFNIYAIPNVYDKSAQGKNNTIFFFGAYVNRKGCYNHDGISDVTKALLELCYDRYIIKYNTSDSMALTRTKAENPITLQEAIMRRDSTLFPVATIMDRIHQIDGNPNEYDDVYTGELELKKDGKVEFKPTSAQPIRHFPHKDNRLEGTIEIFKMPELDRDSKPFNGRYIASQDPYDDDSSETLSLGSTYILDLWTDKIVAEYTGRPMFADDYYENSRRLCLFYNARMNYENNKKGLFAYFSKMNCLYLLTDVLEFLKDKDMIKGQLYGNKSKGTNATLPINSYARTLIRNWLLKPVVTVQVIDGEEQEVAVPNLMFIKSKALLQELAQWNPDGNFDRVSSLGMLMLLREDKMITLGGDVSKAINHNRANDLSNDKFFQKNYDSRFKKSVNLVKNVVPEE